MLWYDDGDGGGDDGDDGALKVLQQALVSVCLDVYRWAPTASGHHLWLDPRGDDDGVYLV